MTDARTRGLPARAAPPPPRGVMRWIASEWGLAALALILAFLVWAVVWGRIASSETIRLVVAPQTSKPFVAYPEGTVVLRLEGPRGELEDVRALLGSQVKVEVADLDPGEDTKDYRLDTPDQFIFPFPRRLVTGVESDTRLVVFRWEQKLVHFAVPELENLPDDIDCDITLDPQTATIRAPATTVGSTIVPDPIDVQADMAAHLDDLDLKPPPVVLTFDTWAGDPDLGAFRTDVVLPQVTAAIRFRPKVPRKIRNRVEYSYPEGADPQHFEVNPSAGEDIILLQRFEGTFLGRAEDLATLEKKKHAWRYLIQIPASKLPAEAGEDATVRLAIEYMHVEGLTERPVKLKEVQATIVIKRKPPPE